MCIVPATVRFGGSIWFAHSAIIATEMTAYRRQWGWLFLTLMATGCAIDLAIAAAMLYYLLSNRNAGSRRMTRLIDILINLTIGMSASPLLSYDHELMNFL